MKTNEIKISVPVMGGGFNEVIEITSDERSGQKLGLAIRGDDQITSKSTDHIVREDADTITFGFGTVRKDRIESLVWHKDDLGSQVVRVNFAK